MILDDASLWSKFKKQVSLDLSIENCLFYEQVPLPLLPFQTNIQVTKFKSQFEGYAQPLDTQIENPVLVSEYIRIYDQFIKPGSEYELNLPHSIVESMRESIHTREFYCTSFLFPSGGGLTCSRGYERSSNRSLTISVHE